MANIFCHLKQGWFCVKIDLKDAYFHIKLHHTLQDYVCMQVGEETWHFQGACFGISTLPQKFMLLMSVWERKWRQEGKKVFVYLDDIFILAPSAKTTEKHLMEMTQDLLKAGFKVNFQKSTMVPTQEVRHLGMWINLKKGKLVIPPEKLKSLRKELGKIILAKKMSCRKISSILGQVRKLLGGHAISKNFNRQIMSNGKSSLKMGVGSYVGHSTAGERSGVGTKGIFTAKCRKSFSHHSKTTSVVRQQHICLGGTGQSYGQMYQGFLETSKCTPHKSKRINSCSRNNQGTSRPTGFRHPGGTY